MTDQFIWSEQNGFPLNAACLLSCYGSSHCPPERRKGPNMRYDYEIACREAGMSEEEIKKIRKVFNSSSKRLQRENERRKRAEVATLSLESFESENDDSFEILDFNTDVEGECILKWELEHLRFALNTLSEQDKLFLMDCFSEDDNMEKRVTSKYGINKGQLHYRRRSLIKYLRDNFF